MVRLGLEAILGFRRQRNVLRNAPDDFYVDLRSEWIQNLHVVNGLTVLQVFRV